MMFKSFQQHLVFTFITVALLYMTGNNLSAQQYNSDNYLTMPHGTGTFVVTSGQRNSTLLMSFALIDRFEFFAQGNLYRDYRVKDYNQHFTTTVYAKYMFWVNEKKNGGGAAFLGFGKSPGYYDEFNYSELHKNVWTAIPFTIPLFNNAVSWDIMPGALVDFDHGNNKETAWGFTWSTRLAIYKIIPKTAIIAEAFGTEGEIYSKPEYKIGLRWEPNDYIIPAISYGSSFDGSKAAGFEVGVIIFTPQFLRKDFIKDNHIEY